MLSDSFHLNILILSITMQALSIFKPFLNFINRASYPKLLPANPGSGVQLVEGMVVMTLLQEGIVRGPREVGFIV